MALALDPVILICVGLIVVLAILIFLL